MDTQLHVGSTLIISSNSNIRHSLTTQKFGENVLNSWHTKNGSSFIGLSTPRCRSLQQSKIKTIGHAITCHILILSCNSNIRHSMNCPKFWRKGPKLLKILKTEHFLQLFHSCVPNYFSFFWHPIKQGQVLKLKKNDKKYF